MAFRELAFRVTSQGVQKVTKEFRKIQDSLKSLAKQQKKTSEEVEDFNKKITASFIGGKLKAGLTIATQQFAKTANEIDKIAKTSAKLGIGTSELIGLQHAGEQTGVAVDTTNMALQRMVRRVSEAASGTGEAKKALEELNISAEQLNRLSPDQQFFRIAKAFGNISSQGEKVRLAMRLFDSEGVALVNTLNLGVGKLQEMQTEAQKLGITFDQNAATAVESMNDSLDRVKKIIEGLKTQVVITLAPEVERLLNRLEEVQQGATRQRPAGTGRPSVFHRFGRTFSRSFGRAFLGRATSRDPNRTLGDIYFDFLSNQISRTETQTRAEARDRIIGRQRTELSPRTLARMRAVNRQLGGGGREFEFTGGRPRVTAGTELSGVEGFGGFHGPQVLGALRRNFLDPLLRTRIRLPTRTEGRAGLAGLGNIAGAALGFGGVPVERRFRTGGGGPEQRRTVIVSPPIESRLETIAKGIADLVSLTQRLVENQPELSLSNIGGGR